MSLQFHGGGGGGRRSGGGLGGESGGFGGDDGGFDSFGQTPGGGFENSTATGGDEEW